MQTFIVHNRRPGSLLRDLGWRRFIAFEIYLGSLILSPMLHTVFFVGIVLRLALTGALPFTPLNARTGVELTVMVVGYGAAFAVTVAGLIRLRQQRLLWLQALLPLYWVLHSIATIRAGHELVTRPHYWAKTQHGVSRGRPTAGAAAVARFDSADYAADDLGN